MMPDSGFCRLRQSSMLVLREDGGRVHCEGWPFEAQAEKAVTPLLAW
jgi:hypothetical protein